LPGGVFVAPAQKLLLPDNSKIAGEKNDAPAA
jgi:hypothetical protein